MNIKEMLNDVLAQSGFLEKGQFFNSSDVDDKQMCAISNRAAIEILNYYEDWGVLLKSDTIQLVSGQAMYDLPSDFKEFIPNSAWETDGSRKVDVPVNDGTWYQYKFSTLTSGGIIRAKFYGDQIEVIEPFTGGSITYEYKSKYPVISSTGVTKERFDNDLDEWLLDEQLLILGIQAHWMQTKLMPQYVEHHANYMRKMHEAIGRDAGGQTIGGKPRESHRAPYTKTWVN